MTMLARILSQYGLLLVLVAVCAFFSTVTIAEQHATGTAGGKDLARDIVAQTTPSAAVVVVVGTTKEDADFADALAAELTAAGRKILEVVRGHPPDARAALEALAAKGTHIDAIAGHQAAGDWPFLKNIRQTFPTLGPVQVHIPHSSYLWPNFLKPANLLNITNQIAVIAIVAIGMTMVIITGGIDLSVGSLMALSAVVATLLIRDFFGAWEASPLGMILACLVAIGLAGAIGLFSGAVVTLFAIPPFIATLSIMLIASGLAQVISDGESIYQLPPSFVWLGRGTDLGNIPNAVVLMALLYFLAHLLMTRTTLGRYIYAVGGNAEAARLSGVPVRRVIVLVYVITGILAGLGGIILASQLRTGNPNYGLKYELYAIAAVVVGGTSLSGGEGKITSTLLGAFLIAVIRNGMNLTGIRAEVQDIVLGGVILGAVLIDKLKKTN